MQEKWSDDRKSETDELLIWPRQSYKEFLTAIYLVLKFILMQYAMKDRALLKWRQKG